MILNANSAAIVISQNLFPLFFTGCHHLTDFQYPVIDVTSKFSVLKPTKHHSGISASRAGATDDPSGGLHRLKIVSQQWMHFAKSHVELTLHQLPAQGQANCICTSEA